jgi:D-xylono/L-arabinono-1,4-lactonase
MADLTIIADYDDACGECPVWDASTLQLYWTDCGGLKFYRHHWLTGQHELVRDGLEINGYTLNEPAGFIVTNNSGIWFWDGVGPLRLITDRVDDEKCQMNDCTADPAGRLLAGSWFYDPKNNYTLGHLVQVNAEGIARIIDGGFHLANGLGFSPDGRTLYATDSVARRIYAYDYDVSTGTARHRRIFVKVPVDCGLPDGLAVDAEGFIWSAEWYGSRVVRYDPDGKLERTIPIPAKQPSSLTFGGPDLTMMFVTSASKSEPMPVMPPGYDPDHGYFGGALYAINSGVCGKSALRTKIAPRT